MQVNDKKLKEIFGLIESNLIDKKASDLEMLQWRERSFLFVTRMHYLKHKEEGRPFWFTDKQYQFFKDLIGILNDPSLRYEADQRKRKRRVERIEADIKNLTTTIKNLRLELKIAKREYETNKRKTDSDVH